MWGNLRSALHRVWVSWVFLLVLGGALFFVAFLPMGRTSPWSNIGALAAAVAVVIFHWTRTSDLSVAESALRPPDPRSISLRELALAEDYVDKNYTAGEIAYFVQLLTQLPDQLSRVNEEIRIDRQYTLSTTTLTFRGARSTDAANLLVPITRARKGLLFDQFEARDADGRLLPTLPQWQVYGLIIVTLRAILERAVKEATGRGSDEDVLDENDRLILHQIVKNTACALLRVGGDARGDEDREDEERLELIDTLPETRFSPTWKDAVRLLCRSLIRSYLIVVETAPAASEHLVLSYAHQISTERMATAGVSRLRAKYGLWPEEFDIPISWAFQTDSYHLTVVPPASGVYVYDHHLEKLGSRQVLRQEDFGTNWYMRLYYEEARPLAHLYVRRQGGDVVPHESKSSKGPRQAPKNSDFKSIVRFREVPPGGLGPATTIALLTAVMVTYFALFRVGMTPHAGAGGGSNTDFAALILTVPALLAGAAGRGMSPDRLISASLTAFYGLWATISTSLAAVLLFILNSDRPLPFEFGVGGGWSFNAIWMALTAFSGCVYLHLRKRKNEERDYYQKCLNTAAKRS